MSSYPGGGKWSLSGPGRCLRFSGSGVLNGSKRAPGGIKPCLKVKKVL